MVSHVVHRYAVRRLYAVALSSRTEIFIGCGVERYIVGRRLFDRDAKILGEISVTAPIIVSANPDGRAAYVGADAKLAINIISPRPQAAVSLYCHRVLTARGARRPIIRNPQDYGRVIL